LAIVLATSFSLSMMTPPPELCDSSLGANQHSRESAREAGKCIRISRKAAKPQKQK
jgi:hypothetical protein